MYTQKLLCLKDFTLKPLALHFHRPHFKLNDSYTGTQDKCKTTVSYNLLHYIFISLIKKRKAKMTNADLFALICWGWTTTKTSEKAFSVWQIMHLTLFLNVAPAWILYTEQSRIILWCYIVKFTGECSLIITQIKKMMLRIENHKVWDD